MPTDTGLTDGMPAAPAASFPRHPAFPLFLAAIGIAIAVATIPFLAELPIYLQDARRLADGHLLPWNNFYPVGYALVLSPFVALFGDGGTLIPHAASYAATVYLAWSILARDARLEGRALAIATALVAFHPYLLLNIERVNDNTINTALALLICRWMLRDRALSRARQAIGYGLAMGLFATIRPNALVFAALPLAARWLGKDGKPALDRLLLFYGAFAAIWAAVSLLATGSLVYWPGNGPYNLFAGNNPFAASFILHRYNGEYSIDDALAYYGLAGVDRYTLPGSTYIDLVLRFVREMPGAATELLAIKTAILFGPRWAQAHDLFRRLVQLALIYPVIFAVVFFVREALAGAWRRHALFLVFALLYAAPFILTNVDPRFRLPLDLAFLVYGLARIAAPIRLRAKAQMPTSTGPSGDRDD